MPGEPRACAFLTMADEGSFVTDYRPGIPPLEARGWTVECVPWREPGRDWSRYDAVYIAAPWDYTEDPGAFLATLAAIEASGALLVNPLALVHWNLDKGYLRDLERRGVDIVPSLWRERYRDGPAIAWFGELGAHTLVIKPRIGANAESTYVLDGPPDGALAATLERIYAKRPFIVQPFIAAIRTEGEYSLFYLGGELSHAIRKRPKPGDFRVQEEHGAEILPATPDAALVEAGDAALAAVEPMPAYARVDFVRGPDGGYLLMELELIEPSLYLRMHPDAPRRFAAAFDDYARRAGAGACQRPDTPIGVSVMAEAEGHSSDG